jgi:hypothetical protein
MSTAVDYDIRHARTSSQRRWRHVTPPTPQAPAVAVPRLLEPLPLADFGFRLSERGELSDPAPLLVNLTRCVIEILAGVRHLDQLARWVTDEVHVNLMRRVTIAARSRAITGASARRPRLTISEPLVSEPLDGVVEAVVMVHQPARSRAVAIRLEGIDGRWRASAITVL